MLGRVGFFCGDFAVVLGAIGWNVLGPIGRYIASTPVSQRGQELALVVLLATLCTVGPAMFLAVWHISQRAVRRV